MNRISIFLFPETLWHHNCLQQLILMSQGIKILAEGAKKFKSEEDLINKRFFSRKKPTHKNYSNFNVRVSHLPKWDPAALLQAHEWASLLETKEYMEFCVTLLKSNHVIIRENCTNKLVQLTRANLIKFFRNLNYKFAWVFVRAEFQCWTRHLKRKPPLKFLLVTSQQNVARKLLTVRKTWPHLWWFPHFIKSGPSPVTSVESNHRGWSEALGQLGLHGRVWGREAPISSLSVPGRGSLTAVI